MILSIYGGSFDPPHAAHLAVVDAIWRDVSQDFLAILIAHRNEDKPPPIFAEETRFAWMKKLCAGYKNTAVLDLEIREKIVKTADSVEILRKKCPQISRVNLVVGSDYCEKLHLWDGFSRLKKLVNFVVVERFGYEISRENVHFEIAQILKIAVNEPISSTKIRKNLADRGENAEDFAKIPRQILNDVLKHAEKLKK